MKRKPLYPEITLTPNLIKCLIGLVVIKLSNKTFKSGNRTGIIQDVIPNYEFPHGKFNALIIDDVPVEMRRCNITYQLKYGDIIEFFDYNMDKNRIASIISTDSRSSIEVDANETDGYQTQWLHISEVNLYDIDIPNILLTI